MEKENQEYQRIYESLKNTDNTINTSKLMKLIQEYVELQINAKQVYSEVTKGLLNNSHYSANTVISVFRASQKDLINKNSVCEDMIHMFGKDNGTEQLILEYFGRA